MDDIGTSSFTNGVLPSGSVTIAAGQATASFNVVVPNGIGTLPEATLNVQISTNTGDSATIVSPNAYVTVINGTPEPERSRRWRVPAGPGPARSARMATAATLNLGNFVETSLGGPGEVAVANTATLDADEVTGSMTDAGDSSSDQHHAETRDPLRPARSRISRLQLQHVDRRDA